MDYEEERKRINCTDEIHQINSKYEDGIIDFELKNILTKMIVSLKNRG